MDLYHEVSLDRWALTQVVWYHETGSSVNTGNHFYRILTWTLFTIKRQVTGISVDQQQKSSQNSLRTTCSGKNDIQLWLATNS